MSQRRRIGIVGYGHLGKYLCRAVSQSPELELAFVWNRSQLALDGSDVPKELVLRRLEDCAAGRPDLIVEVAHPAVVAKYGKLFLSVCDFLVGSPTALADREVEQVLRAAASSAASGHGLYVPGGALWGGEDIRKMSERGTLERLRVTMRKHPDSFKLVGALASALAAADFSDGRPKVLYEGPVRDLCPMAPNNVNTMAAAAVASGQGLGFDGTVGRLVADPALRDWHHVEVEAEGPALADGNRFAVETVRKNPAAPGVVTGTATFASFLSSIHRARGKGSGVHLC